MNHTIIERIRLILKREEKTQVEFSNLSGLSVNTINSVLSRGSNPSAIFLSKLIETFPQYSANWILTGDGNMLIPHTFGNIGEAVREYRELTAIDKKRIDEFIAIIKVGHKSYSAYSLTELQNVLDKISKTTNT